MPSWLDGIKRRHHLNSPEKLLLRQPLSDTFSSCVPSPSVWDPTRINNCEQSCPLCSSKQRLVLSLIWPSISKRRQGLTDTEEMEIICSFLCIKCTHTQSLQSSYFYFFASDNPVQLSLGLQSHHKDDSHQFYTSAGPAFFCPGLCRRRLPSRPLPVVASEGSSTAVKGAGFKANSRECQVWLPFLTVLGACLGDKRYL